jgi:hypothetical protein
MTTLSKIQQEFLRITNPHIESSPSDDPQAIIQKNQTLEKRLRHLSRSQYQIKSAREVNRKVSLIVVPLSLSQMIEAAQRGFIMVHSFCNGKSKPEVDT